MLLEVQPVGIGREIGDLGHVPLDDKAVLAVPELPARHLDRRLVHVVRDAVRRHHLERRRVVSAGAQVDREVGLRFEHEHADVARRERERRQQADRPGAGDDHLGPARHRSHSQRTLSSACLPLRVAASARASAWQIFGALDGSPWPP